MNLFDIKNKVVIVTGGEGQLGRQYVLSLLKAGAKVVVIDKKIKKWVRDDVLLQELDITNKGDLLLALADIRAAYGPPDALINNAAIDTPPSAPSEEFCLFPENEWDRAMDVNVKGAFLCCQVFGTAMAEVRQGSIINVSSVYGMVSPDQRIYDGFTKPISYSASKSALYGMTRYLATYWANKGVRVNTLTLGGVFNGQDSGFVDRYSQRVPMGRMAKPDEYNGAIQFLISDASSYMTGANLVIDGGLTAW